jgi:hypothetical protein
MNEAILMLLNMRGGYATVGGKLLSYLRTAAKYLVLLTLAAAPQSALAQGGGTEQERAACAPDVKRHCAQAINQGDLTILACLQQSRTRLSRACNQVLVDHGQ